MLLNDDFFGSIYSRRKEMFREGKKKRSKRQENQLEYEYEKGKK